MKFLILFLLSVNSLAGFTPFPPAPIVPGSLTQKPDIYSHDGTADAILPPGADGQMLSRDDLETTGLKWINPPAVTPTTILGDMIRRGAAVDERLGVGTVGQLLTADGTTFSWQDAPVSLPDQTGNAYKTLTTNGAVANWAVAERLNDQIKDNLLENPSYERELPSGSLTFVGAVNTSGIANRTSQESIHNAREYVINGIGGPFSFEYSRSSAEDFTGRQMVAYCEIKTARDDVYFQVYPDGTNLLSELKVSTDDTHRYYKAPFVGDLAPEFRITSKAAVASGEVRIDNCFLGVSDNETQEMVGTLKQGYYLTQASNALTNRAGEVEFNLATANIENTGDALLVASDDVANTRTIFTATKDGLVVNVSFYSFVDLANRTAQIYKNDVIYTEGTVGDASNANVEVSVTTPITLNEGDYLSVATGNNVRNISAESILSITALYVSPTASTIVTQETELTAKTANTFPFKISNNGTCAVVDDVFDVVQSVNNTTVGQCDVVIKSGLLTDTNYTCNATVYDDASVKATCETFSTTLIKIVTTQGSSSFDRSTSVSIVKSKAQFKKSRTIVGSFEQIRSDDLCEVMAYGNDSEAYGNIAEDMPWKTTVKDNCGVWDNSGNTGSNTSDAITPKRSAWYTLGFSVDGGSAANTAWGLYKNGTRDKDGQVIASSGITSSFASAGLFYLEADQVYTIRVSISQTLDNANPLVKHYVNWIEHATTESIVANITRDNVEECELKKMSADTSGAGVLADLTFNNLKTDGTRYRIEGQWDALGALTDITNNGVKIGRPYNGDASSEIIFGFTTGIFTPTASTVIFTKGAAGVVYAQPDKSSTWAELCELPKTTILK